MCVIANKFAATKCSNVRLHSKVIAVEKPLVPRRLINWRHASHIAGVLRKKRVIQLQQLFCHVPELLVMLLYAAEGRMGAPWSTVQPNW